MAGRARGSSQAWSVVGGADKGGLLVRTGPELASEKLPDRLGTGAVVEEIELLTLDAGPRLHYRLLRGAGPEEGWITVALSHKFLAERLTEEEEEELCRARDEEAPSPEEDSAPGSGRVRAAFHYTASFDLLSVEMQRLVEASGAFEVERVYTTREIQAAVTPERVQWFHTITKLKQPTDRCPAVALRGVLPHLYQLEEKSLLQEFMAAHPAPSCIAGFSFQREVEERLVEEALQDIGFPCIVKPSNEGGRRGVRVAQTQASEVFRAVRCFSKAHTWVVQTLEQPAFLIGGLKFHLRVFALVVCRASGLEVHMAERGPVYFCREAYSFTACRPESHLSGGGESRYSQTWPEALERARATDPDRGEEDLAPRLASQLRAMCRHFLLRPQDGAEEGGYRLVAFDVLLCKHKELPFQAKVMEVNISPSSEFQDAELRGYLALGVLRCLWPQHFQEGESFRRILPEDEE